VTADGSTPERRRLSPVAVVAAALAAVATTLLGLWLSGAAAPPLLGDPGPVVRWGLPATAALSDLAGAVTIGALALAAFVLPRTDARARVAVDGRAWPAALVVAATAAGTWTVLAVAELVLAYANVAGRPVGGPGFDAELGSFVTSITLGRLMLGVVALAATTCLVALLVTGPRGALVAGLLAAVALVLQAQSGHASGAASHELAMAGMFLHLAGVTLWVGGLVTLAVLYPRLGDDLTPAVARYSTVAAWCFAAVGVSGVVSAWIRLGGPAGLSSTYGALVVGKVVALAGLGVLGLLHRRAVVPRLAERPRVFWRLAAVEVALMGAATGLATALAATSPPVPTDAPPTTELTPAQIVTGHPLPPPPTVERWVTSFRWDLLVALGCLAGVVVYLRWVYRLRARGDRWPVGRTICLVLGLLVLGWSTSGGPAVYGHVLFSAHMIQHMLLVMVAPVLLALSAPVTLAARALPVRADGSRGPREWLLGIVHSRWAGFFAHPIVAAVNFAGSMVVFYFTPLFELALRTYLGHLAMVVHFTLAGYLFANVLVGVDPGPRRPAYPVRLLLLFATMAFHAFFGLALVEGEVLLAPEWYGLLGRPWGPPALEDQQAGGAIAWGISEAPMLALAIAVAVAWTRDDERTARRRDRDADRTGDAELAAYNAMLARLARGERPEDDDDAERAEGAVADDAGA
jgi:putative copper resistance protein D